MPRKGEGKGGKERRRRRRRRYKENGRRALGDCSPHPIQVIHSPFLLWPFPLIHVATHIDLYFLRKISIFSYCNLVPALLRETERATSIGASSYSLFLVSRSLFRYQTYLVLSFVCRKGVKIRVKRVLISA